MSTIILLCRARDSRAEVLTRRTVTWSWHILDQSRVTHSCLRIPVCMLLILHRQWSYHYPISRPHCRWSWIKIDAINFFFFSSFFISKIILMHFLTVDILSGLSRFVTTDGTCRVKFPDTWNFSVEISWGKFIRRVNSSNGKITLYLLMSMLGTLSTQWSWCKINEWRN